MADRPHLRDLADRVGILPFYFDVEGVKRVTKDSIRVALLSAMGLDASSEKTAERALRGLTSSTHERLVSPVQVQAADKIPSSFPLALPLDSSGPVEWHVKLCEESGKIHIASGRADREHDAGEIRLPLPASPSAGYHKLQVAAELPGRVVEAEQSFIVSPGQCTPLSRFVGEQQAFGLWTNLYTLRSRHNMGVGDLSDLKVLTEFAGANGAAFVGVNPLHALHNIGAQISPYCPVSRLYRNVLYLDVEAVPEFADCPKAKRLLASTRFQADLRRVRDSQHVAYGDVLALKLELLRLLHADFRAHHAGGDTARGRSYSAFIEQQGDPLTLFATFMTLASSLPRNREETGGTQTNWRDWPEEYQRSESREVLAFRNSNQQEIDFHCYLQFELDRQMERVSDEVRRSGMAIGLYNDLAIGAAAEGSDAWAFPDLFVSGVRVGAPPDPYSDTGQTWGFPPIDPRRLRETAFDYWTRILRSAMDHAGMLRIDHVMGLFRQFWVPEGRPATEGAYVAYPAEDLLGILALESQRHNTVIVGEDLGTVPPEVPPALAEWEILSSRVLYFERDYNDNFLPPSAYSPRAAARSRGPTRRIHAPSRRANVRG